MTKNTMINVLLFTTGAVIGSLVTWKVMKDKCEKAIQAEIDLFMADWNERMSDRDDVENESDEIAEDEEEYDVEYEQQTMFTYHNLTNLYKDSGDETENDEEGERDAETGVLHINGPYVIDPDDFGNGDYDYDCHSLNYYADGVLADDWGKVLDIERTIGRDSLNSFGEYTEDVVHVRNERLREEYEVVKDPRTYKEVVGANIPSNADED